MALKYGFDYTRYADDLTFSASGNSLSQIYNIIKSTRSIVKSQDFEINENKTKIIRKSRRQEVTGIVVNSELNVSRKTLKRFRATLYNIEKGGLKDRHWGNFQNNDIIASIEGFANFISMVNPEKGTRFQEQVTRIKKKYRPTKEQNNSVGEFITKSDLVSVIYADLKRLHWSDRDRRVYLRHLYGKQSLQQLTEEELLKVQRHLRIDIRTPVESFLKRISHISKSQLCNFLDALCQTDAEIHRLGWSLVQERNYLEQAYGKYMPLDKYMRLELTYRELLEFIEYLKSQPRP
jgi:hypothetical protein